MDKASKKGNVKDSVLDIRIETEWMTVEEVAAYLQLAKGTIYNLVYERKIPFSKRLRGLRFHRQKIDEWMFSA